MGDIMRRKNTSFILTLLALCLIVAPQLFGQQTQANEQSGTSSSGSGAIAPKKSDQSALTNQDIIKLSQVGLDPDVIITRIRTASKVDFRLETDNLIALKKAGVSQKVIAAMMRRATNMTAEVPEVPAGGETGNPQTSDWTVRLITTSGPLDLESMVGNMSYGFLGAMTFNDFPGARAQIRTKDHSPTILLNFKSNPKGKFFLVKTDPSKKKEKRSVKLGHGFMKNSTIPDKDWTVPCTFTHERAHSWQMSPAHPLEPGEYGVYVASNNMLAAGELYDFGVDK